jgi:hypothetical protein
MNNMPNLTSTQLALIGTLSTIAAAVIAAIVSVLTTRYIVKHGPNYDARFKQMHETLEALARTQDELKQQQAKTAEAEKERHLIAERKAEAARWKPSAGSISLIEGNQQVNKLSIQSPEQFVLVEAYLLSDSGARLHDYQVLGTFGPSVGLNVIISHESLLKIANNNDSYFRYSTFQGTISYRVEGLGDNPASYTGEVPFRAQAVTVNNTQWFKLSG